jgi:hypothetical protein
MPPAPLSTLAKQFKSFDSPSLLHVIEFEKGILGEWRLGVRRIQYLSHQTTYNRPIRARTFTPAL